MRAFYRLDRLQAINRLRADRAPIPHVLYAILKQPHVWPLLLQRFIGKLGSQKRSGILVKVPAAPDSVPRGGGISRSRFSL